MATMTKCSLKAPALFTAWLVCAAASPAWSTERIPAHPVKLNTAAYEHARDLIIAGQVIDDRKGAWRMDQPSASASTDFIRLHGFAEYAQWHLGIDESHGEQTKGRYKFPYGDFNRVHRCALLAVKSRATEYGHIEVQHAAEQLLQLIRSRKTQAKLNAVYAVHAVKNASINSGRSSL